MPISGNGGDLSRSCSSFRQNNEERLRFVQSLRTNMDNRMGVVFGGVQRLGIFPLLIALYFQFRDWKWGDWGAAFDVNLFAGLLILAMLLMYGMGWLLVGLRTRLDTYASVLQESLGDTSDATRRG
jgi:hypothetical protein